MKLSLFALLLPLAFAAPAAIPEAAAVPEAEALAEAAPAPAPAPYSVTQFYKGMLPSWLSSRHILHTMMLLSPASPLGCLPIPAPRVALFVRR